MVFLIKAFVAYVIPDLPENIFIKLQREEYIAQEARREYELRPKTNERMTNNMTKIPDYGGVKATMRAKTKYTAFRYDTRHYVYFIHL